VNAELRFSSLCEVVAAIAERRLSSLEVTEALLQRIEETEPVVNAYVCVTAEHALTSARAADREVAAGASLGPLHGVPISVKDLYETEGIATTGGGRLLAGNIPLTDSTAVARLRAAGAFVVGKTNTHEYAYGYTTENPHYGDTRNPWDPDRIAGGSSGGSGASLAAGSALAALGTDTGGSIRVPASFCGITGIKPTYGRVSRQGVLPLSWTLDHAGPMARTVADCALMLSVLAAHDPKDPASAQVPPPDLTLPGDSALRGTSIGIPTNHFFDEIDEDVDALVRDAIATLESLGARCIPVELPHMDAAVDAWLAILLAEAASIHEADLKERPEQFGLDVRLYLEEGALVPALTYIKAQRIRRQMVEGFRSAMRDVDALVTPTTALPAPKLREATVRIGDTEEALFRTLARLSSPFDMTGLPALSVPCGFTASGLPVGLQLAGHPFSEAVLLRIGSVYEGAHPWTARHPDVADDR
jgi:aspartyl-tRNA(Asn)/glutamyl-tRNA(Gln) amidotransferase subunit A